jgi:hypothetical protein
LATDVSVSGSRWHTSASPSLAHLIQRSAQDVPHPTNAQKTLWDAHFDVGPYEGPMDVDFARMWDEKTSTEPQIGPLGSGSDYTVFLHRLGVRLLSSCRALHSSCHCRLPAPTRASVILRRMRLTITTLSMTRRCGKRCMQTLVSTSMFVVTFILVFGNLTCY